jgi:hypothetical protein
LSSELVLAAWRPYSACGLASARVKWNAFGVEVWSVPCLPNQLFPTQKALIVDAGGDHASSFRRAPDHDFEPDTMMSRFARSAMVFGVTSNSLASAPEVISLCLPSAPMRQI